MNSGSLRLLPFALLFVGSLPAQQGDRSNEIQAPVPSHWVIPPSPVLSPQEEAATFTVPPGFRIELAAAEPLVGDPVAAVFGPDGRLWVVEMRSYMPDIDGNGEDEPIGSVAVLTDTDGDGRFDQRTVFLDGLVLPRAVSLVGDGVLVAEPPHLWFARDLDGDGRADSKVEIASDYGGIGNPEHMANGLVWMMDNWIYSANHTTRYRYQGDGKFLAEATITRGQWGITQDDTGRIYYNSNSDPLRVDVVPSVYFRRNPDLGRPQGTNVRVAPADLPTWPGRITPGVNRGYQNLRPDGTLPSVTAACSPAIYRSELFPTDFHGDAFICEPSGNLVKRIRLTEQDGVPVGTNAYERTEFLVSTDERFRPVSTYSGPDGALWVVDMYRGVIQHRTYVTSYLRAQVEERGLEHGRGLGRIWRIVPEDAPAKAPAIRLADATTVDLVDKLASSNGWVRDTAQRLLVERRDAAAVAPLQSLVRSGEAPPLARLHALWTLDGLDALDRATVLEALDDPDARVIEGAIRHSEKWLGEAGDAEMFERVLNVTGGTTNEVSARLMRQKALSLGQAASPRKLETLAELAERFGGTAFMAEAIVSGIAGEEEAFLELLSSRTDFGETGPVIAAAVGSVLRAGEPDRLLRVLAGVSAPSAMAEMRNAILDGVEKFLPRRADGTKVMGRIAVEPTPLIEFATRAEGVQGARAAELVDHLRWPGKPGEPPEAVRLTPAEAKQFEQGRVQYTTLCASCHQPNGQGLSGLAPPLVNSRWALGPAEIAAAVVLVGKADAGQVMPALKSVLGDEAIASVLTYVRNSWGHSAKAVDKEIVARVRAETADRSQPFSEADLVELLREGRR